MRREIEVIEQHLVPDERFSVLRFVHNKTDQLSLWYFKRKLAQVKTGSYKWHILQEKISQGASTGLGMKKRNIFYKQTLPVCGYSPYILPNVIMHYPMNVEIGNNIFINRGTHITAPEKIIFGDDVLIGPYVVFNSGNHIYRNRDQLIREQGHDTKPITVEDDVWIGAHAVILAGVTIGKGAVVAAGAVVSRSVEPYTVVAGVPARVIKYRGRRDDVISFLGYS
jgi:acetyltransferase-like isoleucine patch superfamily enzyme